MPDASWIVVTTGTGVSCAVLGRSWSCRCHSSHAARITDKQQSAGVKFYRLPTRAAPGLVPLLLKRILMTPESGTSFAQLVRQCVVVSLFSLLFVAQSFCQSGAVIPQGGAGHAGQASCVILKRMGPADEVTSHLYSFGIRGKQFQYVEGKLPEGFPFHGRLTDHDVRNLQGRGAEVIVLEPHYTSQELMQAR